MSGPSPFSRQDLEDLWSERAAVALNRYRIAKSALAKAVSVQSDAAPPDGTFAYRQALRAETAALVEYRRVLRIFTDLTVGRMMPPQE